MINLQKIKKLEIRYLSSTPYRSLDKIPLYACQDLWCTKIRRFRVVFESTSYIPWKP
jgi:hypothetical protein